MTSFAMATRTWTNRTVNLKPSASRTIKTSFKQIRIPQWNRTFNSTGSIFNTTQDEVSHVAPLPPPEPSNIPSGSSPADVSTNPTQLPPRLLTGTVTRTGTMQSCIQVTYHSQKHDKHLQKHYTRPNRLLVHDPNPAGYLREGDVVEYSAWTGDEKAARTQRKHDIHTQIEAEHAAATAAAKAAAAAGEKGKSSIKSTIKKPRQGRRFMTGKKRTGNHGTGEEKWIGPRYVFRRVVTPFGTGLDQRMEEVVRQAEVNRVTEGEKVGLKGKSGNLSKKARSAKVAG